MYVLSFSLRSFVASMDVISFDEIFIGNIITKTNQRAADKYCDNYLKVTVDESDRDARENESRRSKLSIT